MSDSLFSMTGEDDAPPSGWLEILPVSVLEIAALGKNGIRGKQDHNNQCSRQSYSPFPREVAELCSSFYLKDCAQGVDPFAGWGERAKYMAKHKVPYIRFDISEEAIKYAKENFGVENTLADSTKVDVPEHDGLLTCPPYWNLEEYADDSGLDRCKTWESFIEQYKGVLSRFADKASSGATYCIMTGDWRHGGVYYDLTYQTEKIMESLGFTPHDKVVVSRLKITKIKIMLPNAKRLKWTVKVHESLNTFRKK